MQYILVEIKQKDLYTIYDVENKGVCCCSAYTLAQLHSAGHKITGFTVNAEGKYSIKECGLDGKLRTKKAPVICTDETKRSAVTIAKGLDEKHYPRVKQERNSDINSKVTEGAAQTYNVAIANKQVVSMKVGDICKFVIQPDGAVQPREIVGVVDSIIKRYSFNNSGAEDYSISIVTKSGQLYTNIDAYTIISVNSCKLASDVRKALTSIAEATFMYTALKQQYNQVCEEERREAIKIREKYAPRYDKLTERMNKQKQQKEDTIKQLMLMDGTVDTMYMQDYIQQHYAERLSYTICRRLRDDCGASSIGNFDTNVYYDNCKSVWRFEFTTSIDQRTSYMELRAKPFFQEEYDGELFGLTDEELNKVFGKIKYENFKQQYQSTLAHNFKGGMFELSFDASGESRKGYYAYRYAIVYEFKGKSIMELSKFKEILQKIFK